MKLKIYKSGEDFLNDNRRILEENDLELDMFWRNVKYSINGFFGAKAEDGDNVLLASRTGNFPVVLYSQGDNIDGLAKKLVQYYIEKDFPDKVSGAKIATEAFVKASEKYGKTFHLKGILDRMQCSKILGASNNSSTIKYMKDVDYDFAPFFFGFNSDCHLHITEEAAKETAAGNSGSTDIMLLMVDDKPVSMAGMMAHMPITNARSIGKVYTPPEFRNNGYSTTLMRKIVSEALDRGYFSTYLYVINPIAKRIYEKVGFVEIGSMYEYELAVKSE